MPLPGNHFRVACRPHIRYRWCAHCVCVCHFIAEVFLLADCLVWAAGVITEAKSILPFAIRALSCLPFSGSCHAAPKQTTLFFFFFADNVGVIAGALRAQSSDKGRDKLAATKRCHIRLVVNARTLLKEKVFRRS